MMKAAMAMLRVVIMGVSVELKAAGPPNGAWQARAYMSPRAPGGRRQRVAAALLPDGCPAGCVIDAERTTRLVVVDSLRPHCSSSRS
jgi:hypothetical protein